MQELAAGAASLAAIIEKGGIIGVLLIICVILGWAVVKLRKELAAVYAQRERDLKACYQQRDKWRLAYVKCKSALDNANIKVDLSDLAELTNGGGE